MTRPICLRLELVCEKPAPALVWVKCVSGGEGAGAVDEVRWVDYRGGRDEVDDGAEFEEEGRFFGRGVCGHATRWEGLVG